ncbi:MAG: IS110 family transposase [Gemmatimonadota bacterium]|nr:IS110 family transposase [Gemmatimonadota bacterium]
MRYVGLDVHWRQSTICVLDHRGRKLSTQTIREGWSKVLEEVGKLRKPFSICFEASSGYGFLFERLATVARRVVVAHPGQLRLIFRSKRKNDRVDAEKLAKLLFLDEVPPVHVPSVEVRSWRSMIEHRRKLVAEQTRTKNGIRSLLRSHGVEAPRGLWTRRGLAWLASVRLATEMDELQRDIMQERLQLVAGMIQRVERVLNRMAEAHAGVRLFRTIPGVGPRTGEAVVAYIDEPGRFHRNKAIGSYFGLVPKQDASGRSNRLGHITREGPASVRGLLVEAAWQGIRRCPRIRQVYERIQRGDKERKKIALVATAHHLLRAMLAMLQTGEVWRYSEEAA